MNIEGIKPLGVGISYKEQFHKDILFHKDKIDFLEIIADAYIYGKELRQLDILSKHYPLVFHGIEKSIGNYKLLYSDFIHNVRELRYHYKSPWVSLHCATTSKEQFIPLAFTKANSTLVTRRYYDTEMFLDNNLILENISYDTVKPTSTMSEIEFYNRIAEKSNVKFLLDVTNIYSNAINHGYNPFKFIDNFPLERVVQLHFTGGRWKGNKYVDSHSSATPEHVWELMEYVLSKTSVKGIVLERDDESAQLKDLIPELEKAKELWLKYTPKETT